MDNAAIAGLFEAAETAMRETPLADATPRSLLGTPDNIKAKALDVLRQLDGLSYSDALYSLDIAQRTMQNAVERLHEEQVFSPPIFQVGSPKDSGGRP